VGRVDDLAFFLGLGLGVLVLITLFSDYRQSVLATGDFAIIWSGSRALVDGVDPYDPLVWSALRLRYGMPPTYSPIYTYPPWVAVALLPFAALPFSVAALLWTVFGVVLAALALRALLRSYVPGLPAVHSAMGFVLVLSQPGVATFFSGQFGFVLVASISGIAVFLRERRSLAGGLATLAFLTKPQYFVFASWALLRASLARGQRSFAVTAIAGGASILAATFILSGEALVSWARSVAPIALGDQTATTLPAAFGDLGAVPGLGLAVAVLLVAVGLGLCFDPRGDAWLAVWIPLSLLGATYARSYDQLILLPALVIAAGTLASRSRRAALGFGVGTALLFSLGSILLQALAAARNREDTTVALTLAVFALNVGFLWRQRRERIAEATERTFSEPQRDLRKPIEPATSR
jgi:hypothetical protein